MDIEVPAANPVRTKSVAFPYVNVIPPAVPRYKSQTYLHSIHLFSTNLLRSPKSQDGQTRVFFARTFLMFSDATYPRQQWRYGIVLQARNFTLTIFKCYFININVFMFSYNESHFMEKLENKWKLVFRLPFWNWKYIFLSVFVCFFVCLSWNTPSASLKKYFLKVVFTVSMFLMHQHD